MMLPRSARPSSASGLMMFSAPPGCMSTGTPSSAALAQNGSYFGSDRSSFSCVTADGGAAQPSRFTRVVELLRGEVRELQRDRGERVEARRGWRRPTSPAPRSARATMRRREIAVGVVPPVAVDAQHLHVDALLVDRARCAPGPSMRAPPPAPARSNSVPLTTASTSGTVQCAWMSTTRMRLPPIDTCRLGGGRLRRSVAACPRRMRRRRRRPV